MTERPSRPIKGILFDVDGTLVDSNYFHTVCWWQAFRQQDIDVPMALLHRAIGMGSDMLVEHVLKDIGTEAKPDQDALSTAEATLYAAFWARLRPLPGAVDMLRRCHQAGLTTVLASSAKEDELKVLQRVLGCDDAIDFATSSADAEASKPAPDIVAVALKKSGLDPSDSLFVGDSIWDVQASGKLDVACIGLESGGTSAAELREAGAFATYQNAQEMLQHSEEWLST